MRVILSIYLILPPALDSGLHSASNRNEQPETEKNDVSEE
jgi:hypothetical protein